MAAREDELWFDLLDGDELSDERKTTRKRLDKAFDDFLRLTSTPTPTPTLRGDRPSATFGLYSSKDKGDDSDYSDLLDEFAKKFEFGYDKVVAYAGAADSWSSKATDQLEAFFNGPEESKALVYCGHGAGDKQVYAMALHPEKGDLLLLTDVIILAANSPTKHLYVFLASCYSLGGEWTARWWNRHAERDTSSLRVYARTTTIEVEVMKPYSVQKQGGKVEYYGARYKEYASQVLNEFAVGWKEKIKSFPGPNEDVSLGKEHAAAAPL